ncbi:chemotaxis protein [Ferviditalea candida]|uniref:Chemotaxis protein n=1 Tax=Ferviditalea candida TaxID=3108399 RepID=A0ABU5ZQD4_9BACL|nr:chemotaxis protein [Paenibacillaceae bacterium T2]
MTDFTEERRGTMNISVAVVHGMGPFREDFYKDFERRLKKRLAKLNPDVRLTVDGVYWSDIPDRLEDRLWEKANVEQLRWKQVTPWIPLRSIFIHYLGDAIAYQPVSGRASGKPDNFIPAGSIYEDIHERFAQTLSRLADKAGGDAPLCVVSHSLGTVIASNYFYDLQHRKMAVKARRVMGTDASRLERGETLTHFYTLGSPIALWTLRHDDFGIPIRVPCPEMSSRGNAIGEWVNFYDKDDIIAYPIKNLSRQYNAAVTEDLEINCAGFRSWTPFAHGMYFKTKSVLNRIAASLNRLAAEMESFHQAAAGKEPRAVISKR